MDMEEYSTPSLIHLKLGYNTMQQACTEWSHNRHESNSKMFPETWSWILSNKILVNKICPNNKYMTEN